MSGVPVITLTPGEPAGIGPDITIDISGTARGFALVVVADPAVLEARAKILKRPWPVRPWMGNRPDAPGIYINAVSTAAPVQAGKLDPANSPYVLRTLDSAIKGCLDGTYDALVTGPVHKGVINEAGLPFTGHTEFLAERSGADQVVMMLATQDLRVALATTHLPLAQVAGAITRERLRGVLRVLHRELRARFRIAQPRILVCGLNPHAGEGGHLGREEIEVIEPVLRALRAEGMVLRGPHPADTAFLPAQLAENDVVLAMYHDQGLPVLKHHDFAHAVNITLGLPFVRTSVDHGTALELAGSGRADSASLAAALDAAVTLSSP